MRPQPPPRNRTRCQWDDYFKNLHTKVKDEVKGTSDSDGCKYTCDFGSSTSAKFTKGVGGVHKAEKVSKFKAKIEKTKGKFTGAVKVKKPVKRTQKNVVAGVKTIHIKEEKESCVSRNSDVILLSDDDDVVECLGEEVVSNGSNVRIISESRSGSCSKVDDIEFVNAGCSKDPREPCENSDVPLFVLESSEEEAGDFSDEDYEADGVSNSVESDVSESDSSFVNCDESCDDDESLETRESSGDEEQSELQENSNKQDSDSGSRKRKIKDESTLPDHQTPSGKSRKEVLVVKNDSDAHEKKKCAIFIDDQSESSEDALNRENEQEDYVFTPRNVERFSCIRSGKQRSGKNETNANKKDSDSGSRKRKFKDESALPDHQTSSGESRKEVLVVKNDSDAQEKKKCAILIDDQSESSEDSLNRENEQENSVATPRNVERFSCIRSGKQRNGKNETNANKKASNSLHNDEKMLPEDQKEVLLEKNSMHSDAQETNKCSIQIEALSDSSGDHDIEEALNRSSKLSKKGINRGKDHAARNLDMAKILLESIYAAKEGRTQINEASFDHEILPSKFCFDDEVQKPQEKSEWDLHIDSLFQELEFCERLDKPDDETCFSESEINTNESIKIDESPAACCSRDEHQLYFDEQIGILCKYCSVIVLDVKHIIAPFYKPPSDRRNKSFDINDSPTSVLNDINYESPNHEAHKATHAKGTVWDLILGFQENLYPHQREGFEFMWNNLAGDIKLENLKQPLSNGGRGCIISHAPGTGKTRLSILFLYSFLKLYPNCRPVIIAPRGMLLTWESEFKKWNVDIPFHNMNNKELSGDENTEASNVARQVGNVRMSRDCIRLLKLYSWIKNPSVLGVSYTLFEKLVEGGQDQLSRHINDVLLQYPGLLVLDEGHTPRNDQSILWNAFMKVVTPRRIILSGTPFQNNLTELYNTLRLVNPMFERDIRKETQGKKRNEARRKWIDLTSSIGKCTDNGVKLKEMLHSFVHVHKGNILEERLPGLRCTIVFLHPTERQKTMLETAGNIKGIFHSIRLISLISVHPSLMVNMKVFSSYKTELQELESDIDSGVKLKFLLEVIALANALGERVLVFSQFIDPLIFIKKHIESYFKWNGGREVLYMDGKLDERVRQRSISSFNNDTSEAKVLLASERACSEGINLVGASRVILLDTVWNPSVEKQAISRAYRLGQTRVVYVYRLFTSGTEVRQYEHQVQKERMSELIFSPLDGQYCNGDKTQAIWDDQILDSLQELPRTRHIFDRIICQEKESDFVKNLGLTDVL